MPIPAILRQLQYCPAEAEALRFNLADGQEASWSFAKLQAQVRWAAGALREEGLHPGTRLVLLLRDDRPQFLALLLAAFSLDCCVVPLPVRIDTVSLRSVLERVGARLAVVDTALPAASLRLVQQHHDRVLRLRPEHTCWLRRLLSRARPCQSGHDCVPPASGEVLLLCSSGSTGTPKLLRYTGNTLSTFLAWQQGLFAAFPDQGLPAGAAPSARLNLLPPAHFGALSHCLQGLLEGRCLWLGNSDDSHRLPALLARSGCQLLLLVPALYRMLLDHPLPAGLQLRYCLSLGEALPAGLQRQLEQGLRVPVFSTYGMSEALSGIGHAADMLAAVPPGSCGRLLFGTAELRDPDTGQPGSRGELWVRNATTAHSCHVDPLLARRHYRDGWYRSGDLFHRDEQGWYYWLGRGDALCQVNGRNLYPVELEAPLRGHPAVVDCCAVPLRLVDGRQRPALLVQLVPDSCLEIGELLDHCLQQGALPLVPAWIMLVAALPRTANGKLDRAGAAAMLAADYAAQHRQAPAPAAGKA